MCFCYIFRADEKSVIIVGVANCVSVYWCQRVVLQYGVVTPAAAAISVGEVRPISRDGRLRELNTTQL